MAKDTRERTEDKERIPWRIARERLAKIPESANRSELERELLAVLALLMPDAQKHESNALEFSALDLACNALDLASLAGGMSDAVSREQIGRVKKAINCLDRGTEQLEKAELRWDALVAIHEVFERPGFAKTETPSKGLVGQLLAQREGRPASVPQVSKARILAGAVAVAVDKERYAHFGLTFSRIPAFKETVQEIGELRAKDELLALAQQVIDLWAERGKWKAINALLAYWGCAVLEPVGMRVSGSKHPLSSWYFAERKRRLSQKSGG